MKSRRIFSGIGLGALSRIEITVTCMSVSPLFDDWTVPNPDSLNARDAWLPLLPPDRRIIQSLWLLSGQAPMILLPVPLLSEK